MRVLALLWLLGFVLKEVEAWSYSNGIFHNSIWLGKTERFLFSCCGSYIEMFFQKLLSSSDKNNCIPLELRSQFLVIHKN